MLTASIAIFAQATPDAQPLAPEKTITREIKGGDTHIFKIDVPAGRFAQVEVEQKGVDVAVTLLDAAGKTIVEMDGKSGYIWRETVSAIAGEADTTFRVTVRAYGTSEQAGSYSVKFAEPRRVEAKNRTRLEAEYALQGAHGVGTPRNQGYVPF